MSDEEQTDPSLDSRTGPSRREMLQFMAAFGVAMVVPSVARAEDPPYAYIPYGNIVAKAMQDPQWRQQLVNFPKQTLAQAGIALGPNVVVQVVEDTFNLVHVVLCKYEGMRGPETGPMADILTEVRTDELFRNAMLDDPRSVFEDWTGVTLPINLQVVAVLERPLNRVIHLPPTDADDIIADAEAESWWGGDDPDPEPAGPVGTIESGQVCNCYSQGSPYDSAIASCCTKDLDVSLQSY